MKIVCLKNGPILITESSLVYVIGEDGEECTLKSGPIALCRCGQSANKPFCDGAHVNGFEAEQVEMTDTPGVQEAL